MHKNIPIIFAILALFILSFDAVHALHNHQQTRLLGQNRGLTQITRQVKHHVSVLKKPNRISREYRSESTT